MLLMVDAGKWLWCFDVSKEMAVQVWLCKMDPTHHDSYGYPVGVPWRVVELLGSSGPQKVVSWRQAPQSFHYWPVTSRLGGSVRRWKRVDTKKSYVCEKIHISTYLYISVCTSMRMQTVKEWYWYVSTHHVCNANTSHVCDCWTVLYKSRLMHFVSVQTDMHT